MSKISSEKNSIETDLKEISYLSDKIMMMCDNDKYTLDALILTITTILIPCNDQELLNKIIENLISNLRKGIRGGQIITGRIPLTECTEQEIEINNKFKEQK